MLPFLKNKIKPQVGVIVKQRAPDAAEDKNDPEAALEACAIDLIDAVHARDIKKVAQVLKDAFELMESQPHVEAEHIDEEMP